MSHQRTLFLLEHPGPDGGPMINSGIRIVRLGAAEWGGKWDGGSFAVRDTGIDVGTRRLWAGTIMGDGALEYLAGELGAANVFSGRQAGSAAFAGALATIGARRVRRRDTGAHVDYIPLHCWDIGETALEIGLPDGADPEDYEVA